MAIDDDHLITLPEKLENILRTNGHKDANISSVKGPCLASGLAHKMRTSTVIANENIKKAQEIQSLISTEYYKCEITNDVPGVEFSSAIKNIYSMLIGAAEGLSNPTAPIEIQKKFYLNTSASLIHRSISEMAELVSYYSGKVETVIDNSCPPPTINPVSVSIVIAPVVVSAASALKKFPPAINDDELFVVPDVST